jgi:hypothetical protein
MAHQLSPERQRELRNRLAKWELEAKKKSASGHSKGHRWKQANYIIGGLSLLLGSIAGAAVFSDLAKQSGTWQIVLGSVTLTSGLLGALVGFYNFGERTARNLWEEAAWEEIAAEITLVLGRWDDSSMDDGTREEAFRELAYKVTAQKKDDANARRPK